MRAIPSEKDLDNQVKLVEIKVTGEYIARIDDKRRTSRRYEIAINVPEGYSLSDIKRQTPKALMESKEYTDFITMRTFEQAPAKPKKTDKTIRLRDFYSQREIERFSKLRKHVKADKAEEMKARRGSPGMAADDSDYDPETGLPPLA